MSGIYLTKHETVAWRYAYWVSELTSGKTTSAGLVRLELTTVYINVQMYRHILAHHRRDSTTWR